MLTIIANPRSGKGSGKARLQQVEDWMRERTLPFESRVTAGPGDAIRFARESAEAGSETLVVLGGDGTFYEVVNGIMGASRRPRLAQIPVGTGNSFIKDLGIDSFEDGLAALADGKVRRVDVGRGQAAGAGTGAGLAAAAGAEFYFVNLCGAGFVAHTARRAGYFRAFGDFAYVIAVLLGLPGLRAQSLRTVADGVETVRDAHFIEICNSRKTGGDMIMAPSAKVDDGLFDVVIAKKMTRRQLLDLFPQIFTGKHVESPLVETFTCTRIEAAFEKAEPVTPDGELLGTSPLSAEIIPLAIEVYAR